MMDIKQINDDSEKQIITRCILESLLEWFGIPKAREEYIEKSLGKPFFCACEGNDPIGFIYLQQTGKDTIELAVMGVLKEHHRKGVGRKLFEAAKEYACKAGYSLMQVKTVQVGRYEEYDKANKFYISMGFKEFEVFSTMWDEWNPCQVYVMPL